MVTWIGNSILQSTINNTCFKLDNLLHVPYSAQNLISVSRFARDNNVLFEFYPNHCYVKSEVTKEVFLQDTFSDGVLIWLCDNSQIYSKNISF